jgi:hypothetical protein
MDAQCLQPDAQFIGGAWCLQQNASETSSELVEGGIDPRKACIVEQVQIWQTLYVDALQAKYPRPRYTGMNILGAVQAASGVPGASVGHPVKSAGSKCDWMVACVHPKYGTPTASAVGQAMWDLWLANRTSV